MSHRIDKRDECVKAIRHLDLQGKSPEEIIMLAWTDGWDHALDAPPAAPRAAHRHEMLRVAVRCDEPQPCGFTIAHQ